MADLFNLLDGIEEPQEQLQGAEEWEQDREEIAMPTLMPTNDTAEDDEEEDEDGKVDLPELPYQKLQHMWRQELYSPELMSHDQSLVQDMLDAVREREDTLGENNSSTGNSHVDALLESILKIDMDRAKYLAGDLVKLRMEKIQRHPLHMRTMTDRMTEKEVSVLGEAASAIGQLLTIGTGRVSEGVWCVDGGTFANSRDGSLSTGRVERFGQT